MIAKRSAESAGLLNALYDNRGDPESRLVLDDARRALGEKPGRLGVDLFVASLDAADADAATATAAAADADAATATAADADAATATATATAADAATATATDDATATATDDATATATDDATATATDDAADADAATATATATAAAADAATATRILTQLLTNEEEGMPRNGLKVVTIPGGYYGYAVTRVGWLRRVVGDEYELVAARTVIREGQWSAEGLNQLAANGPGKKYRLSKPDEGPPEELHRLTWRRCIPCVEKAWADEMPKPPAWDESVENVA